MSSSKHGTQGRGVRGDICSRSVVSLSFIVQWISTTTTTTTTTHVRFDVFTAATMKNVVL
jgi:hypothetical protein